ncbi:hypothetical protein AB0I34_09670 [Kribbella sp. NPDC050281]|uniref:transposase n=1 Tax=Kribbella sp. NPDC050281 TaxID=3155515 RepID=UPI0033E9C55E
MPDPAGKLYVVRDNYGPHKKTEVLDWRHANGIELVVTPSNASWLNWIECEFTALRYFTLDGSDYPSHTAQETAIAGYVRLPIEALPPGPPRVATQHLVVGRRDSAPAAPFGGNQQRMCATRQLVTRNGR